MKSLINNNSEIVEMRFCYLILIFILTLFAAFGTTRALWFQILFLPFIRIISLYSSLPKLPKILMIIIQTILIIFFIICYLVLSFILPTPQNYFIVKLFASELLLVIIFHRFIFFAKCMFVSKYLLPSYRIFKKLYIDILLVIVCYIIVYYSFLPGDFSKSFDIVGIVKFLCNFDFLWHTLRFYICLYLIFIGIAAIWFVLGTIYNKRKTHEITCQK
jgi:hypothetical protein